MISVCIPTYKGTTLILETLESIFKQSYTNFEVVICNDSPSDNKEMGDILNSYKDKRIKYYVNEKNLGYPLNLRKTVSLAKGEIVFLMGQDDIVIHEYEFQKCIDVFREYKEVGAITRPYYWFGDNKNKAIRQTPKYKKRIIGINDSENDISAVLETVGQLSGLVYKKGLITEPFNENVFPAHIYPFISIMKTHKIYFREEFTIAVRTLSSQTRFLSSIYNPSPTKTWCEMFNKVWKGEKFDSAREVGIRHITRNFVGLAQIKNYGFLKDLLRDIYYLVYYNPRNLFKIKFWLFAVGALFVPRGILRRITDYYKKAFSGTA